MDAVGHVVEDHVIEQPLGPIRILRVDSVIEVVMPPVVVENRAVDLAAGAIAPEPDAALRRVVHDEVDEFDVVAIRGDTEPAARQGR